MEREDPTFFDLACILRISQDTVLEKFGSVINANFLDAQNIAGSLKQKGLIDFAPSYPGPSIMVITEYGRSVIADANIKSAEPLDQLDSEILLQMSGGKRRPDELGDTLNIRGKDLAFRLYKLYKQELIVYNMSNANIDLILTETGFLKVKEISPTGAISQEQAKEKAAQGTTLDELAIEIQQHTKKTKRFVVVGILVIIIIILGLAYYMYSLGYL